jgi:hypothetical protein
MKLLAFPRPTFLSYLRDRPRRLIAAGALVLCGSGFALGRNALQDTDPRPVASAPAAAVSGGAAAIPSGVATDQPVTAAANVATVPAPPASTTAPGAPPTRVAPVPKPVEVRGLYLNAWAAGSPRKLAKLIGIAQRSREINAFVIDVKEGGELSYRSSIPLVRQVGADRGYIRDVRALLAQLRAAGIYPIARIVVFKDRTLAEARPDWAIQRADGSLWLDNTGHPWVDSYNRQVWDYNIAIAREAIELGFAEVQWDYVRFPDVPRSFMASARWPAAAGRSKPDAIREFLLHSREQLASLDVPVTADVFGLTVSAQDDMGIGQLWSKLVDATDVLLPMVYPSHFARGSYGIARPNAFPYGVVKKALEYARRRTPDAPGSASVRPWLQDFTLGSPRYGPAHVRAQIRAVYDAGYSEWVLWNPGSNYTVAALAGEDGVAPEFPLPGEPSPPEKTRAPAGPVPLGTPVPRPRPDSGGPGASVNLRPSATARGGAPRISPAERAYSVGGTVPRVGHGG